MTRVNVKPYHSLHAGRHGGVYHDRADCPDGSRIPSDHMAAGTGSLPRCELCAALQEKGRASKD